MRVPQCNPEIWKINLSSFQRSAGINLQKILMKASYAIVNACYELIVAEETEEPFRTNTLHRVLRVYYKLCRHDC